MIDVPRPYPGLVVRHNYLWHDENLKGQEDGIKHRPVVIVTVKNDDTAIIAPITHHPKNLDYAIRIPLATAHRLGLDNVQSWIICNDLNQFFWPGCDLGAVGRSNTPVYGHVPQKLFQQILIKIGQAANRRNLKIVPRTL